METILIVDDEKNYTLILAAILEDEGFETLTANSGSEALDILSESDVDLVLTDMKMPSMDGIQLLERIKKEDADLPGNHDDRPRLRRKGSGGDAKGAYNYILKPFDNERLVLVCQQGGFHVPCGQGEPPAQKCRREPLQLPQYHRQK
jgi:two-component system NtrC family response regulator